MWVKYLDESYQTNGLKADISNSLGLGTFYTYSEIYVLI